MACKSHFEEYAINGVKVKFPYKPYPSQFTMMDKIIKSIERRQNSLLESPTGSGKSLALLCSSLAWLMVEKEKILKQYLELKKSLLHQMTENIETENSVKEEEKPDVKVKIEQLNESNDVKPNIKTEPNPDVKVKIEKLDESNDVKPNIKTEPNPDVKVKIEKQDEVIDQKPVKSEADAVGGVQVKIEKTDESFDEKPKFKNETGGDEMQTTDKISAREQTAETNNDACMAMEDDDLNDDDADFQAPKKRFRTPGGQIPKAKKRRQMGGELDDDLPDPAGTSSAHPEWSMELNRAGDMSTSNCSSHRENDDDNERDLGNEKRWLEEKLEMPPSPKIYFGTRTHKQITQIVRELNKTEYKTTKMCILASREHTCIHPQVSKAKNKTEECRKSVENKEGKSCRFHARARYVRNQEDLEDYGITKAWDISELVEIGEKIQGCPYYMTREIVKDADIIFCPYNYLIDPLIREQMDISLANQIVILDEAHNIEDSSRNAASWSVTPNSLDEAMKDLDYFVSKNIHREQHQVLHEVCATMRRWIVAEAEHQTGCHDYSKSSKIWEGQELKQALNDLFFVPAFVRQLTNHLKKVLKPPEPGAKDKWERTNMHPATATMFEGLLMVLYFIMKDDYKHLCDYRVAITKEYALVPAVMPNGFRRKGEFEKKLVYTLNFWCLSPAVVFSEISQESRSVILTSGTLSPMSTFSSELGCKFPIQLEANHVVGSSQVWVSSLAVGPSGSTLNATYRFAETFEFQDEIGEAIHRVCEVVPHGVLCFLPSYSMLDKLMNRWKMTGLWGRLCRVKNTFSEPRRGDKTDFNDVMTDFYDCIKLSEDSDGEYGTSGALFFAVCRGKVSEGLDFADNNARAVITVGIPFPNVKDIQVELKRKYNNQYCSAKGLLNGNEWYEIQAYRALNQALGRCIRHRNDWGAILLIDERFGKSPKYRNGLSKWIRGKVVHHNNFPNLISSLKKFAEARLENPCPNKTMLQTPTATPRRSTDSNETKSNQGSPISVNSRSQSTQTPPEKMDISGIKKEPGLITTPTPNCPQTTPQVLLPVSGSSVSSLQQFQYTPQKPTNQNMSNTRMVSGHNHPQVFETANQISEQTHVTVASTPTTPRLFISANQVSSSTPVVGRGVAPKMLHWTPLNRLQLAGTADNPQRMPNPQQVVNVQHIVIPQTAGNNGVIFNIFGGGQQTTPGAGLVQLGGVGQGIRLNITGQPGAQNIRFNMATQPRAESTSGEKVGPTSTSGVNAGVQREGLLSTPGIVRVKQEPQSPPEIPRENEGQTSGVNQGSNGAQGGLQAKGNRILRKPLFSSNESLVPGNKEMNKEMSKDINGGENENVGQSDVSTLLKRRNNAPKPLEISGCGVTEPKDGVLAECGDPDSPLLFCTPPTSFESSDDETEDYTKGGEGVDRVKMGHVGVRSDRKVLEDEGDAGVNRVNLELFGAPVDNMDTTSVRKIPQKDGGEGVLRVKSEPMDTTMDRKVHEGMEMVGVTKNNDGLEGMDGSDGQKDILDILDDAARTIISNNVTWNVKCKACDSAFYSTVNSTSDDAKPREEEVFTDTMLGNILNSLFSLNTNRKKKTPPSLTTLHAPDVNVPQGCCPAFAYGNKHKQDMKLNSIYCEEESRCYISLVCKQCKELRTARGRSIIAVRAVPCGSGDNKTKSMIWFNRDKVELFSPG